MKSKIRLALTLLLIGSLVGFSIPAYAYNLVGTWSSATVVKNDSAHNVDHVKSATGNQWTRIDDVSLN